MEIMRGLCKCSKKIKKVFTVYEKRLLDISEVEIVLAQELSKYYNKKSVFRPTIEVVSHRIKNNAQAHNRMVDILSTLLTLV